MLAEIRLGAVSERRLITAVGEVPPAPRLARAVPVLRSRRPETDAALLDAVE